MAMTYEPYGPSVKLNIIIHQFLSIMNCASRNLVLLVAACKHHLQTDGLLQFFKGMAKEAEMMCAWLIENKPVNFSDDVEPYEFVENRMVRYSTLNLMMNILEECSAAAAGHKIDKKEPAISNGLGGDGDGVAADAAANYYHFTVLSAGVAFQMY